MSIEAGQRAFEAARIAELAPSGVPREVARALAQDEWRQMDEAARKFCCQQADVAADLESFQVKELGLPPSLPVASDADHALAVALQAEYEIGAPGPGVHVEEPGSSSLLVDPPGLSFHVEEPGLSFDLEDPPGLSLHVEEPGSSFHVEEPGSATEAFAVEAPGQEILAEIIRLRNILDSKSAAKQSLLDTISKLRSYGSLPDNVLGDTLIGKSLTALSKNSQDETVRERALELVQEWRVAHRQRKAPGFGGCASSDPMALPKPLTALQKMKLQVDKDRGPRCVSSAASSSQPSPAADVLGGSDAVGRRTLKRKLQEKSKGATHVSQPTVIKQESLESSGSKTWLKICSGTMSIDDEECESEGQPGEVEGGEEAQRAYRASQIVSLGGLHPDWLTEPASVAQISLPALPQDMELRLPTSVARESLLSSPQLESVAYAARRFSAFLPNGARCGYYLGDGTGCGKGRIIAALAWHLWNTGASRHVWLSATADLIEDAIRDFRDLGADLPITNLSRWGYGPIGTGKGLDSGGNGIIFASYSLLVSERDNASQSGRASPANSRLMQLIDWLKRGRGEANGLIALDEAHKTKNVADELSRTHGSKTGWAALELVRACPKCAVLYASATGATEIRHLGYLERLGLWGPGRPHASFEELQGAVDAGGLAAMELIAMTMRAEGMLSCRALSFKGTSFRLQQVKFDGTFLETYVAACTFWQTCLRFLVALSKSKKSDARERRTKVTMMDSDYALRFRQFWACQQQFFRQLLVCGKVDEAVKLAQSALIREEAVVIAMWSTGESITAQRSQRGGPDAVDGFASAPEEIGRRLLEKVFKPMVEASSRPQFDTQFKELRASFSKLKLPSNPLDELIDRLGGPTEVAELTGRSQRLVKSGDSMQFQDRGEGCNLEEQRAFQSGRKRVAVITEAASAGISLHCDLRLPEAAQRPRYMITIELPWEADKAVQQLGRVHRSNQRAPPKFAVVVSDLGGEVRFVSAVARRLRILGAMMRGDRNSAHGSVASLAAFDVQNRYGRRALSRFYELLRNSQYTEPEIKFSFLKARGQRQNDMRWPSWTKFSKDAITALESIGLKPDSDDKFDESMNASKSLNVFMNRILMLEPGIQNALFDAVAEIYSHLVSLDRAEGSFDAGLESLDRQGRQRASVSVSHREVLYKDPETSAETIHMCLRIDRSISWAAACKTKDNDCDAFGEGFYWEGSKAVLVVARPKVQARPGQEDDDDDEDTFYDLHGPCGISNRHAGRLITYDVLQTCSFKKARDSELAAVEKAWKAQLHQASDTHWAEEHVLSGSILNTWAVVGSAMGQSSSRASAGAPKKIPLVRAQLTGGGAVVGVKVRPQCLEGVRYALNALGKGASEERASTASGQAPEFTSFASASAVASPPASSSSARHQLSVPELSEHLEKRLKVKRVVNGWGGAHALLVEVGLADSGAQGMLAAQEAVQHLERNGKIDIDKATGTLTLLEKQKGNGWYIPPPKKPKTTGRGRGRGRGRGGAKRKADFSAAVEEDMRPWDPPDEPFSDEPSPL